MERRNCRRYPVCLEIEITEMGSRTPARGNTTDVSLSGCYVATIFPLPIGAVVELQMRIDDGNIRGHGSVQTCHGGVGMGIKFTNLTHEAMRRLDARLEAASSVSAEDVVSVLH